MKKSSSLLLLAAVIATTVFTACEKASFPIAGSRLYFGSYPTNEVVDGTDGTFMAVDGYALNDGDVIADPALYAKLEHALWDENDDTTIDGKRYHRLRGDGAVTATGNRAQHYRWEHPEAWHYFAYAPIKWRVLSVSGGKALLLADRMLDSHPFHDSTGDVSWSGSRLRQWLNTAFLQRAFTPAEQESIVETAVENAPNHYFGTSCGPDTKDRVFLLSEADVFSSNKAVAYGFDPSDGKTDPARRFHATLYAKCRGAWWSPKDSSRGGSFWFLRTSGYTAENAVYVGAEGDIYNRGQVNTCEDAAVLPAVVIDLSRAPISPVIEAAPSGSKYSIPTERYTGDSYGGLNSPWVREEHTFSHETRWSCLYFGAYPANEIVGDTFNAVDDYALADGDVILDPSLFARLEKATWDDADDTMLDGVRYHRLRSEGAVTAATDREQHYRWRDLTAWHYFAYAPIKWRVLKITGSKALLLADRMPDTHPFHGQEMDIDWGRSDLRRWLNDAFLKRAFSRQESAALLENRIENAPNAYFGTPSGPETHDKVFILSGDEVFNSPLAADYGFYPGNGLDDPARRFRSTLYAKCRGAWWSPVEAYRGNSFWLMRTSGYTPGNITYICDFGYIYNQGTLVTCDDAALLPAITIDLSSAGYTIAPEVSSKDIIR